VVSKFFLPYWTTLTSNPRFATGRRRGGPPRCRPPAPRHCPIAMVATLWLKAAAPPDYSDRRDEFTVEIHHGGFFVGSGSLRSYVDESVSWFECIEADTFRYSLRSFVVFGLCRAVRLS